jgi:hypothetical protein
MRGWREYCVVQGDFERAQGKERYCELGSPDKDESGKSEGEQNDSLRYSN